MQNPNHLGESFYYEVSEFYSAIEPTKTTSIRKKDMLTIVIHKRDQTNWPSLSSQITEANVEEEETARDKSDTPVKERPQIPRSVRESKEEIPVDRPTQTTLHRSPGRTKLAEERVQVDSGGKTKQSTEGSVSRNSHSTKLPKKNDSGAISDPFLEEISKDFKDLRNSKQDPLAFTQTTPSVDLGITVENIKSGESSQTVFKP